MSPDELYRCPRENLERDAGWRCLSRYSSSCRAFPASLVRLADLKFSSIYPDRKGTGEAGEGVRSFEF
jgi:hypothetical protein